MVQSSAVIADRADALEAFRRANLLTASPASARRNIAKVGRFLYWLQTEIFTTADVQDYLTILREHGLAPKTICNHHGAISAYCHYLASKGVLPYNVASDVRLPRLEKRPPVFLDDGECREALEIAREHGIYCEVCLALNTGLRMSELRFLEWRDVDLTQRKLMVRKSKSKKFRTVWLNHKALNSLVAQWESTGMYPYVFPSGRQRRQGGSGQGPWDRSRPRGLDWWARVALKPIQARIAKFRATPKGSTGRGWHTLRHTFASRCVQAGVPIYKLSKWLGHSSVNTTAIYAHLSPDFDPDIERI